MALEMPVTMYYRNMLFNVHRECWAVYQVSPFEYNMLGRDQKEMALGRISRLWWHLDYEGHWLSLPTPHPIREHFEELKRSVPNRSDVTDAYCDDAAEHLEEVASRSFEHGHYVAFKLPAPQTLHDSTWDYLRSIFMDLRRGVNSLADDVNGSEVFDYEMRAYTELEETLHGRLLEILPNTERAGDKTMQWLLKHPFFRGLGQTPLRVGPGGAPWEPSLDRLHIPDGRVVIRAQRDELQSLAEGDVDCSHPRRLAITQDVDGNDATAYQSFLALASLPLDGLDFPGCEWAYGVQRLSFPVAVSCRWMVKDHMTALAEINKKQMEAGASIKHAVENGANVSIHQQESANQLTELEHRTKTLQEPTVHMSWLFCVWGSTQRECNENRGKLITFMRNLGVQLECPAGDQWNCFVEFYPGGRRLITDWVQRLTPETAASPMPGATFGLGDPMGSCIALNAYNKPVFLDPTHGPQLDRTGSALMVGSLGGGKSYLANLLSYLTVFLHGGKAMILDPKSERGHWPDSFPELAGRISVVTLSARAVDNGKLDPLAMALLHPDLLKEVSSMAVTMLSFLVNAKSGDPRMMAIMSAVDEAVQTNHLNMRAVVDILLASRDPHAQQLGEYLDALSRRALANLIFGDGTEQPISAANDMTIVQLEQAAFPEDRQAREDYTIEQTISVACMHAICAVGNLFLMQDTSYFKALLLDEGKLLDRSAQGRELKTRALRTGRSKNAGVYIIGQNTSDAGDETVYNNLGYIFAFRSPSRVEAEQQLSLLGLDATEDNIRTVQTLPNGTCIMRDLYGRCGQVRITSIFQHIHECFNTRPKLHSAASEQDEEE